MFVSEVETKPSQRKLLDLIVLLAFIFLSAFFSITFNLNFLFTTILFFGLPSLHLIIRKPSNLKKATVGALLFGLLWGFSFDFIAEFNHAWSWSTHNTLLFPGKLLGVVSLDIMVWFFLWIFLIINFYEYFVEYDFSKDISKNAKYSFALGAIVLILIIVLFNWRPAALIVPYTYLVLGILALCQFLYVVLKCPSVFPKALEVIPFFILLYISFELTALHLGLWDFPGTYIGTVQLQNFAFPLEEFFFWIITSSAVAVSYHELYIDDQK